ncbi:MAG: hypothetical protein V3V21_06705, partial [Thermoplasmata archaeon]
YSHAGIRINKGLLPPQDYESTRDSLTPVLRGISGTENCGNLVEWVAKREDLYSGPFLEKYPDILFKLRIP